MPNEMKIVAALASGKKYQEIADEQHVSFRDISAIKKRGRPPLQTSVVEGKKSSRPKTTELTGTVANTRGQIAAEVFPLFETGMDVVQTVIETSHDPEQVEDLHKLWRDSKELKTLDYQTAYNAGYKNGRDLGYIDGHEAGLKEGDAGGYKRGCAESDAAIKKWRYMYSSCPDCNRPLKHDLLDSKDRKLILDVISQEIHYKNDLAPKLNDPQDYVIAKMQLRPMLSVE